MRRILAFESLRLRHAPLVLLALATGFEVAAFEQAGRLNRHWLWRRLIVAGRLRRLHLLPMKGDERAAIDVADRLVDAGVGATTLARLTALYENPDTRLLLKRALAEELSATNRLASWFRWREAAHRGARVWLLPHRSEDTRRLLPRAGETEPPYPEFVSVVRAGSAGAALRASGRLFHAAGLVFAYAFRLLLLRLPGGAKPGEPHRYSQAFALSAPFDLKFQGPRRFSFAIDEALVRRGDTLFLLETPAPAAFGQQVGDLSIHDASSLLGLRALLRRRGAAAWQDRLLHTLGPLAAAAWRAPHELAAMRWALGEYLRWSLLLREVRFDRYLYSNKESGNQIAANILLRNAGIESWNYSRFIGGPYMLETPHSVLDDRNVLWSFLNPDRSIVNTPAMARSFAGHRQQVRRYDMIGSLFGEMIAAGPAQPTRFGARPPVPNGRVIAIFDTSYIDDPLLFCDFGEAAAFLRDMLRLSAARPGDAFIFKPSKDDAYFVDPAQPWSSPANGAEVLRLRQELRDRPNVAFTGDDADTTEVSAAADLTVTHCMSSPTADAIAAGKPAIWYESGEALRGYPLARPAGAMAHGFDELLGRIEALLPPGRPPQPLPPTPELRDLIEPFADGRGLSRFRELIATGELRGRQAVA